MSHPRVEEVSDSDVSDPSEDDIDDFSEADIMRRVGDVAQKGAQPARTTAPGGSGGSRGVPQQLVQQQAAPRQGGGPGTVNQAAYSGFQCLYPIYFDATRTRAEGRRVPRSQAVRNPLASEIAQACGVLRLQPVFEPTKTHPQDWANPGRVRVKISGPPPGSPAAARAAGVKNKHHLFLLVARHLRENPAREDAPSLRSVAVPGLPVPDPSKPWPRPAVPRGWKVGDLLPHYSPALTGGGISENFLQDMMKEMQQGGGPSGPADMASMLAAASGAGGSGNGGGAEEKRSKKGKGKK